MEIKAGSVWQRAKGAVLLNLADNGYQLSHARLLAEFNGIKRYDFRDFTQRYKSGFLREMIRRVLLQTIGYNPL